MKYPFYEHKDIRILGVAIIIVLIALSFSANLSYIFPTLYFGFVLVFLGILLIGHEIMIILFEKFKLKGYKR